MVSPLWATVFGLSAPQRAIRPPQLAETIGHDGVHFLTQLYGAAAPAPLRALPAVDMLRQVWVQQYYQERGVVRWRDAKNFPPSL